MTTTSLHANVLQQLTGWVTSWFIKETLFQKAVKSGSLTITTANGSILLEYREDFGRYSLGMVDEHGKITLMHAKSQMSLQREVFPYLEKIERQNGLIAQATQRDVSRIRCDLEDAGLIEEERGVITFKDGGALIKFTGDDRDEKLALYLRWAMPEEAKPSTFERAMMGVVGLTMLGSVIAPAVEAISRVRTQFFSDNETISRLRAHLSPHSLECTAGLVVSSLCVASGQNKELCVALPMLSCLGKALAEIVVVNPIPDQMAYPGQDFTFHPDMLSIFQESDPSLPMQFSMTQANGSPLPNWLSFQTNNPRLIGSLAGFDYAAYACVVNNKAYVTDSRTGLKIVSVADPTHPSLLGTIIASSNAYDEYILGDKVYVIDAIRGLLIISIANPYQPSILSSLFLQSLLNARIYVLGDKAYAASYSDGLIIVSVTDPLNPSLLGSLATSGAHGIYVVENTAYLADQKLDIISVQEPSHPFILGSFATLDPFLLDVYVIDNIAYVVTQYNFLIISVVNPYNPSLLGSLYVNNSSTAELYVVDNKAYIANISGLFIFSVVNPREPTLLGEIPMPAYSVQVVADKAYVAASSSGFNIISVANPFLPSILGSLATQAAFSVQIKDDKAYVIDQGVGLKIVSIVDPAHPSLLVSFGTSEGASKLAVLDDKAYILDTYAYLKIISVTNSTQPSLLGSFACAGVDVYVVEDKAYVVEYGEEEEIGLEVISVTNPFNPTLLGSIELLYPSNLCVSKNVAYVTGGTNLRIISVANPSHPSLITTLTIPSAYSLYVDDDKLYVGSYSEILIISIVDPSHPSLLGSFQTSNNINIYVVEKKAYVVDSVSGVKVISVADPSHPTLLESFAITANSIYVVQDTAYVTATTSGLKILDTALWQLFGTAPTFEHGKVYNITVTAQNTLKEKASTNFLLEVYDEGPHVVSPILDQTVHIGHNFDFTVPSGTFTDPYGDALQYTSTLVGGAILPSWLTFNVTAHRFKGTPLSDSDIKDWEIEVKATDPYAKSAATDFTLSTLHLGPAVVHGLNNQATHVGHLFDFTVPSDTFEDLDELSLTYSSELVDGAPLPTWLKFNSITENFSGSPSAKTDIKTWSLEVRATDPYAKSVATPFNLTVINSGPFVVHGLNDQTLHIGHLFDFIVPSDTFGDLDEVSLSYTSTLEGGAILPSWLTFNTTAHRFKGTPLSDSDIKDWEIEVKATDPYAKSAATDFTLSTLHLGPVVTHLIANQTLEVGKLFVFTVPENTFLNQDAVVLAYSSMLTNNQPLPTWLQFNTATQKFSGTTQGEADIQDWDITVKVDDTYGKYAETNFYLDVYKNGIKVDGTIPQKQIFATVPFEYNFPEDLFIDQDDLQLKYKALLSDGNPLPLWLMFDSDTRTFSGVAPNTALGTIQIRLFANDNYDTAHVDFTMLVYPFHYKPPSPDKGIPNQKAYIGKLFKFVIPSDAFINPNKDKLTYNAFLSGGKPLPEWLSFDKATHTFQGSPRKEEELSIVVTATDSYKASAETSFSLDTINQTIRTIKTVFSIGGPAVSVLGAMITVYANKANIRNWWKKKKYQLPDETIQIGMQFTHKITKTSARNIGEIRVFKREKRTWKESSTGEYISSWWNDDWEELPAKQLLPIWLEYRGNSNELCALPQKMTESDIGDYKVRICDKDKYRLEEFILHLQGAAPALEEAPPRAASSAESSGAKASAELQDPVQGDMREPLLRDEDNVT